MNILKLLASESFLTVNKPLARLVGLEAAALFADLASAQVYWDNEKGTQGEYFYRTRDMIEAHTTLSAKLQLKAEKELKRLGLIQVQLKGLPATNHYSIGQQEQLNLLNKISPMGATRQAQTEQLDTTNGLTIKNKEIKNKELRIDNNKEQIENQDFQEGIKEVLPKPSKKQTSKPLYPASFTDTLIKACDSFFDYRKDIKKPYKNQASMMAKIAQFKAQAEKHGEGFVIFSINETISNGWTGTFADDKMIKNYLASIQTTNNNGNQPNNLHPETAKTVEYLKHCIDTFDLDTL
jgi:hypothetical protein